MFSVLNVPKKAKFSLNTIAMTAVHSTVILFWLQHDIYQLRSQNIVICNNPTAGDTGKPDGNGKADTSSALVMPA